MTSKSVKPHAQSKILGDFPSPTVQGFTGLRAQPSFGAPGYTVPVRLGSIPQPYQCAWARFLDLGSVSRFRRPCQCVWARFKTIPPHPVTTHHRPPPAPLPPPETPRSLPLPHKSLQPPIIWATRDCPEAPIGLRW